MKQSIKSSTVRGVKPKLGYGTAYVAKQDQVNDALALAQLIYDVYKQQGRDRMAAKGQKNANQSIG